MIGLGSDDDADNDEDEEEAPDLIVVDPKQNEEEEIDKDNDDDVMDLSKMTQDERNKLKQEISSTRVFSASDFRKMRKLVEREERARRDPREAARRKRAIARGEEFDELSDDDDDFDGSDDEDDAVRIKGAVDLGTIMAEASRKRISKAEKLQKILSGREKFETKLRAGGSTNTEKERKKNFLMTKSSKRARTKGRGKGGLSSNSAASKRGHGGMGTKNLKMGHENKKRRRKG